MNLVVEEAEKWEPSFRTGYSLYAILCQGYVKLGIAKGVKTRLQDLQCANPLPITLLGLWPIDGGQMKEREIHKKLKMYHHRGEWFQLPEEMIQQIKDGHSLNEIFGL